MEVGGKKVNPTVRENISHVMGSFITFLRYPSKHDLCILCHIEFTYHIKKFEYYSSFGNIALQFDNSKLVDKNELQRYVLS